MRRLALVPLAALVLAACNPPPASETPVSGPPTTDAPEVLPMVESRVPYQPAPTTTAAPTTTHTHPPTTTTTAPVVPLTTEPAVVATTALRSGNCGGWGDIVLEHFGDQAAKACQVIGCETGYTYDPTIENPRSSASGLLQFIDSTWVKARALVGAEEYPRAKDAPGAVQIAAGAAWLRETSWSQWECA